MFLILIRRDLSNVVDEILYNLERYVETIKACFSCNVSPNYPFFKLFHDARAYRTNRSVGRLISRLSVGCLIGQSVEMV